MILPVLIVYLLLQLLLLVVVSVIAWCLAPDDPAQLQNAWRDAMHLFGSVSMVMMGATLILWFLVCAVDEIIGSE